MANVFTRFSSWTTTHRKLVWLFVFVLALAVLAIVLTPVFLIMPFKAQTPRTLQVSFLMRNWSPILTLKIFVLEHYWFDWRIYHPDTAVYELGSR